MCGHMSLSNYLKASEDKNRMLRFTWRVCDQLSQWGLWRRLACWEPLFCVRYCFEFEVGTGQLDVFYSFIFPFLFSFWLAWLDQLVAGSSLPSELKAMTWQCSWPSFQRKKKHWKQWVDQVTVEIEPMRLLMTKPFLRSALYYNWGWATELWQNICNECQKLLSDSHLSSPFGPWDACLGQPDPGPVNVGAGQEFD